jgi:hypothetical protein
LHARSNESIHECDLDIRWYERAFRLQTVSRSDLNDLHPLWKTGLLAGAQPLLLNHVEILPVPTV